jgi:uncharacterized membrane protein
VEASRSIIALMPEAVLLDTVLKPAPPMPPRALAVSLGIVAIMNFALAAYFVSQGAWPVMPFMGLDVALLAWAFRAVSREAKREERIVLTPSLLRIEARPPKGPAREWLLNPYWVRVAMDDPPEHASQLTLWSHGKGILIGKFLPPAERASLAERLKAALSAAKVYLPSP